MNNIVNSINYPSCCEVISENEFYIKDVKNGKCEKTSILDYHLKISNFNNKTIVFLKIDKCVYDDGDSKKCDCVLADESIIYFVEIKEIEKFDDHFKKKNARSEAKKQLINTINLFKEKYSILDMKNVNAVIALQPKLEDNYINIITLKKQNVIDSFMESCGTPFIYEGNHIKFK